MTKNIQVTTESWEIGTTWEADWSHHATSLRADTRAWYMIREGTGSVFSRTETSVWTESPHGAEAWKADIARLFLNYPSMVAVSDGTMA